MPLIELKTKITMKRDRKEPKKVFRSVMKEMEQSKWIQNGQIQQDDGRDDEKQKRTNALKIVTKWENEIRSES